MEPAEIDGEEHLRVIMVRLIPQAGRSRDDCSALLRQLARIRTMAERDVRALDAWHSAFEQLDGFGVALLGDSAACFLDDYSALLELWLARTP